MIDTFAAAGMAEQAAELADLAVKQEVWRHPMQRPFEFYPSAPSEPLYDPGLFWFTKQLEESYPQIREEVDRVTDPKRAGFIPAGEDGKLIRDGDWDQVIFWDSRSRSDDAAALFPVISSVVSAIPDVTTFGVGIVTLSWLSPGAHIVPHCGNSNARLRVHFGIRVPEDCWMRVGDEVFTWTEGKCVVFDDSFEHEVWHRGTEPRVVLILDVVNPLLRGDEQRLQLERRTSLREQIMSFMNEHGLKRIEASAEGVKLVPTAETEALVRRYMSYSNLDAAEVEDGVLKDEAGEPATAKAQRSVAS